MLLYRLECLPLTSTLQDKLYSAYRRILHYALGVYFLDCISNAELTRRTGATALSNTLRQERLRLVGHAQRMANQSPLTILLRLLLLYIHVRSVQQLDKILSLYVARLLIFYLIIERKQINSALYEKAEKNLATFLLY